jgi:hypothetical protein
VITLARKLHLPSANDCGQGPVGLTDNGKKICWNCGTAGNLYLAAASMGANYIGLTPFMLVAYTGC